MDAVPYPAAPPGIPPDLARPSGKFRLQAWAAVLGLAVFLAVYFGLAAWFAWIAYTGLRELFTQPDSWLLSAAKAFVGGFFSALMVKGVFFVRRSVRPDLIEITEAEEPALFHFVRQIARDAGAPRPHRVFLSARVNAAVFYDVSLLNLILPSRKNLEVGIGLVNTLSIDEFKAVVAHEFGHFAQRTMSVGAWVYIAQQVVGAMVARRDVFDRMLDGLSRTDIRIAWIGWSMRLVVWSLRAVFDTAFRGLILLERALSRQMEFQADLVSVSLSGSDSLVHALHRLGAADDAWDRAMGFCAVEQNNGRRVADLFAVQSRVLERMAVILDDPEHGRTPRLPDSRNEHRLFSSALADVPRMWSSHPPNHEREESAKRRYFPSALDPRPAWLLFREPAALRAKVSEHAMAQVSEERLPACVPIEVSLAKLDEGFSRPRLDPKFRGAFLREPLTRHAMEPSELVDPLPADPAAGIAAAYPPSLSGDLERCKELGDEQALLEGLKDGFLVAPGGVIRFRGREIRRKDLARVLDEVSAELDGVRKKIEAHDRAARAAYRAAARRLGRGWEEHLAGLMVLVHYAEHTEADLSDARGHVRHVVEIVTADERVTESEMRRLQASGCDLAAALRFAVQEREHVRLPAPLKARFEVEGWEDLFPDFQLDDPEPQDFGQGWLAEMEQAIDIATGQLDRLRNAALDALVQAEAEVARGLLGEDIGDAPQAGAMLGRYTRLRLGNERPRQKRLGWWDRFITADGFVAGTARLAVASAILMPLLAFSFYQSSNSRPIVVHNGLGVPVHVEIGDQEVDVSAHDEASVDVSPGNVRVRATTASGEEIEEFVAEHPRHGKAIYNVAGASVLVSLTATYGTQREVPPQLLGTERWVQHSADFAFSEPPSSVEVRAGGGDTRSVIRSLDELPPETQIDDAGSRGAALALARVHALYDPPGPALARWLELALDDPGFEEILQRRMAERGGVDVALARLQMDRAAPDERARLCEAHAARGRERPDDPDALYLAVRCMPDGPEQDRAFAAAFERFPKHPYLKVAAAWGRLGADDWSAALLAFEEVLADPIARDAMGAQRAADLIARLRRMVATKGPVLHDLYAHMPELEGILALESGRLDDRATEAAKAFRHLGQGDLKEALWVNGVPAEARAMLVRQVGASEGATREQIDAALAVPATEGIAWSTGFPAIALARREGKDSGPLEAELAKHFDAKLFAALDARALARDPALLDRAVVGQDVRLRGSLRAAGIVLLGKQAPMHWRQEARAFLFAPERPYLGK